PELEPWPLREPFSLTRRRGLDLALLIHRIDQLLRTLHIHVAGCREACSVDPVRPGSVLPAPFTEAGIHAAHGLHNTTLDIEHVAASRVIVNVLVVLVQDFYLPLRRTLRLVEDRHQMRLRRLHI